MDSKLQFSANYIFQRLKTKKKKTRRTILNQDEVVLVPEPTFDSETGESLKEENLEIQTESSKNSIYLMQNLKIGNSNCLMFFDSGANAHLIDRTLAIKRNFRKFLIP